MPVQVRCWDWMTYTSITCSSSILATVGDTSTDAVDAYDATATRVDPNDAGAGLVCVSVAFAVNGCIDIYMQGGGGRYTSWPTDAHRHAHWSVGSIAFHWREARRNCHCYHHIIHSLSNKQTTTTTYSSSSTSTNATGAVDNTRVEVLVESEAKSHTFRTVIRRFTFKMMLCTTSHSGTWSRSKIDQVIRQKVEDNGSTRKNPWKEFECEMCLPLVGTSRR